MACQPYEQTAEWWDATCEVDKERHADMAPIRLVEVHGEVNRNAWSGRRTRANRFDISFGDIAVGATARELDPTEEMIRFLGRGRTRKEIGAAGYSVDSIALPGYDIFETRDHQQRLIYMLLPQIEPGIDIKPKCWTYRWAMDTDGASQPYLMIQMPHRPKWPKLKVVPLADVHHGAQGTLTEKLREYVAYIAREPNVFAFLGGDLVENAHGDSNRGISHYEQRIRPRDQETELIQILAPIAHKILWAIPGGHEDRSRTRDYDPLERICERLKIPYSYEPVFVDICWRGTPFSFYNQHGHTSSQTKGGKMNAAARPQDMQDFVMFTIMAHVHDGDVSRNTRVCRDRVNFRLALKKQYIIICPSFYGYFGTYASKAAYRPGSFGSISLDLFPNGDYHANA